MIVEYVIRNVWIVFEDQVQDGVIFVCDGQIVDIFVVFIVLGEDFDGDYVIFGFVEFYIDYLELYYLLCFGVCWNMMLVIQVYDV